MSHITIIAINGEIYNLGNLTDGDHTIDLSKVLTKNGIVILQGDVADNLEDTEHNKLLSANQNKKLDEKIDTEIQRAKDAESALTSNLNIEVVRATGVESDLNTAIANEKDRANKAEKANAAAIKAVTDDYLKNSDKIELKSAINTEKSRIDAFLAAADTGDKTIDTLKEIQNYIDTHGEAAVEMTTNIGKNTTDIKALQDMVGEGESSSTLANRVSAIENTAVIYPKLTDAQKASISSLIKSYRKINSRFCYHKIEGTQTQHSKAATRNDYASKDTALSDNVRSNGRYKIQCSLFVQLIWMGRKASDFPSDTSLYTSTINKLFDWGYYFDFSLRKRVYGMHIGNSANTKYNGFVKPNTNSYNESYSYTTTYTGATDDPSGMGQTYTNFMGASEMARELYVMGCEIPYSELDVGDLVFFRTPSIADGKNDVSEWMSFRNINHVAIVSRIDASGNPVFAEAIEAFDSSPIMLESIESVANAWQAPRCSALMRWAVMCARHPAAFSKGGNVPSNITVI